MNRRRFLSLAGAAGTPGLAGCTGVFETRTLPQAPPVPENRPDAVYVPSHREGMLMAGRAEGGDYAVAVTYSYPHRFWNLTGASTSKTPIEEGDTVHLMATVWDPETNTVLPETGLSLDIERDGEFVSEEVIYPMLSQPMGVHYGANFPLPGGGTYTARVTVGGMSIRRTGAFAGRFDDPASIGVTFEWSRAAMDDIAFERLDDRAGTHGALDPMEMDAVPVGRAPERSALPGDVLGEATTGDAVFVLIRLESPPSGVEGDGGYLAVSARTPYNRMVLPAMALSATVARDGETMYDGPLERTLDPDVQYHYGATVESVEAGDEITVSVETPPQIARHEGYETAFLDMPDVTITA